MYFHSTNAKHQHYTEVAKSDFSKIMHIWNERCPHLAPRSFIIWYDLDKNEPVRAFGLDSLGLSNLQIRTLDDLLELLHPDQKKILHVLFREVKSGRLGSNGQRKMLWSQLRSIWRPGIHLSIAGSVKKTENEYWSAHIMVEPIAMRSNTSFSTVFIWIQITGIYTGTPLTSAFFPDRPERYNGLIAQMNQLVQELRNTILDELKLTKHQKALMKLMATESNPATMAEKLGISMRTLEGHRRSILLKGNDWFTAANFRTALEVVTYLQLKPQ